MTSSFPAARKHHVLLVALAYIAFISLGLPDGLNSVAWPSIRAEFGLPLDALGALITMSTIGYLASSFSSGRILAHVGVGWLLAASCLVTAVSLLGYGMSPAWAVMVGLGLLAGLGAGAIDSGLNTYAADEFSPSMMNWLHAFYGLGAATGPILMSSIIAAGWGWRPGYMIVGAAQVVLALCFIATRTMWQIHHEDGTPVGPATPSATMLATLSLPKTWLSILMFFLYTGLEVCAGQWTYTLLTESRGIAPSVAGAWVSGYWGCLTVGRLLSGAVVTRLSVQTMLRGCMALSLLSAALIWLNLAPWVTMVAIGLLGLSLAPMFPSLIALTPARMGPEHSANTVGFQIAAAAAGGALLASSFGFLARNFGLELLGPFLLVVGMVMTVVFLTLERGRRG